MLKEGEQAPAFRATADDGKTVSLADYRGRNLVLYFYPKADTTGCTHQAVEFTAAMEQFRRANAAIMGCSGDSVEAQAKFKAKYDLNFPLLADTEFEVIGPYGARRMKSFFGKSFLGIVRIDVLDRPRRKNSQNLAQGHAAGSRRRSPRRDQAGLSTQGNAAPSISIPRRSRATYKVTRSESPTCSMRALSIRRTPATRAATSA